MKRFFITSCGTGIGKTLVTTALCWQLRQAGKSVAALKPVISGYDAADMQSDSALILKSCGIAPTPQAMERISPWRYAVPLAPAMAAQKEGKPPLELDALVDFCRSYSLSHWERGRVRASVENGASGQHPHPGPLPEGEGDYILIEGVGGVMAPLNGHHTVLDWIEALGWPVIVVCGSYLGAISHALTAVEVLSARKQNIRAAIVSESEDSTVTLADTAAQLEQFVPSTLPVVQLPRLDICDEPWTLAPPLRWICE